MSCKQECSKGIAARARAKPEETSQHSNERSRVREAFPSTLELLFHHCCGSCAAAYTDVFGLHQHACIVF